MRPLNVKVGAAKSYHDAVKINLLTEGSWIVHLGPYSAGDVPDYLIPTGQLGISKPK